MVIDIYSIFKIINNETSKYNFIIHLYVLIHWIFTFIFYFHNQLSKELFEKYI